MVSANLPVAETESKGPFTLAIRIDLKNLGSSFCVHWFVGSLVNKKLLGSSVSPLLCLKEERGSATNEKYSAFSRKKGGSTEID